MNETEKTAPKTRGRGPSPEKTAQTKSVLLDAALTEFVENGFANAQMSRITERAGIAKGTAYRYFPTKAALFEGVVAEFMSPLTQVISAPILEPGESVATFLRRTLIPVMKELESSRRADVARLVLAEGRNFPFIVAAYRRAAYDPTSSFIRAVARIALDRGELADDLLIRHPQLLVAPLWLAMIEAGVLAPEAPVSGAELLDEQIDLFFPPKRPSCGCTNTES